MAAHAAPPKCVLTTAPTPNTVQTIVLKVAGIEPALLWSFAQGQLLAGQGLVAIVQINKAQYEAGLYFVLTSEEPHKLSHWEGKLKHALGKLPGRPELCWARALTTRLQRLFCWGDASTSRADVAEAYKLGDDSALHALIPGLEEFRANGGDVDPVMLYDALREPTATIKDCQHVFEEVEVRPRGGPEWSGAKAPKWNYKPTPEMCDWVGVSAHRISPAASRCKQCQMVVCMKCARALEQQQDDRMDLDAAVREVQQHSTTRDSIWRWAQHPERPLPFFVINPKNINPDERLAWVTQELHASGRDQVDLEEFAQKFVSIFGRASRGEAYQKKMCLETFAMYQSTPAGWKAERDLPPSELECFQRVWDPQAPSRCLECSTKLEPGRVGYCCADCKPKPILGACGWCGCVEMAPGRGSGWEFCAQCNEVRKATIPLRQSLDSLMQIQWGLTVEDETRAPAWKLRRRS